MSLGTRELILARLAAINQAIVANPANAVASAVRNRGLLDQDGRPALVLMDGDEAVRVSPDGRGRQRMSPSVMGMSPHIYIILKNAKPQNEDVGQDLNTLRGVVLTAIAYDAQLLSLIGSNGTLQYLGCETDLKSGELAEGQMRLDLLLSYHFNPYS